ncbi:MAG: hypothetical protein J0L92_18165 [Deltaproteobacteria bacterium]|nr:hypothetical protein [Deltaproteobacteria bacterium]
MTSSADRRSPMERLNLNVPQSVRADLQRLAKRRGLREAEAARELLVKALEDAEHEEFLRQLEETSTPELRAELRKTLTAMEEILGRPR